MLTNLTKKKSNSTADSLSFVKMEQYFKNNKSLAAAARKFHTKLSELYFNFVNCEIKKSGERKREREFVEWVIIIL